MNRQTFFASLPLDSYIPAEMIKIRDAYWLAKESHRSQKRDGGQRYFEHPRDVTLLLIHYGYTDAVTICAGLLHDALEDTYTPPDLYVRMFGGVIWQYIQALSKVIPTFDPISGHIYGYFKKELADYFDEISKLPPNGRVIKLCDRLHNLRTSDAWPLEKRRTYAEATRKWILPIAFSTDVKIARDIETELQKIDHLSDASQMDKDS